MREHAGIFDLSAFAIFDVAGPGALDALQHAVLAQMDVPVGRVVYTPVLSPGGGFKSDLTIMRLDDELFRIVTGGAHGMADRKLFVDALPADGSASLVDVTTAYTTIGALGPAGARHPLERHLRRRLARGLPVRPLPHDRDRLAARARLADLVRRRPRLGALRADGAGRRGSGTCSGRRASRTRSPPAGSASTARRAGSRRPTAPTAPSSRRSTTSSRPGMQRPKVKEQDFVGKEAHLRHREEEPAAILCTLTVDDHASAVGREALPARPRADRTLRDGDAAHRREGPPLLRDERRCRRRRSASTS